ncbi:hypothetical protein C8Q73DRAFT_303735 [Cubamyces lactineus]|nr:hypothetical protein C8Q73DRAFT_303735 [Cubamyces lactineus]
MAREYGAARRPVLCLCGLDGVLGLCLDGEELGRISLRGAHARIRHQYLQGVCFGCRRRERKRPLQPSDGDKKAKAGRKQLATQLTSSADCSSARIYSPLIVCSSSSTSCKAVRPTARATARQFRTAGSYSFPVQLVACTPPTHATLSPASIPSQPSSGFFPPLSPSFTPPFTRSSPSSRRSTRSQSPTTRVCSASFARLSPISPLPIPQESSSQLPWASLVRARTLPPPPLLLPDRLAPPTTKRTTRSHDGASI